MEHQFLDKFGQPELAPVTRIDIVALGGHIPSCIVKSTSFSMESRESLRTSSVVKIIEFGEAFFKDKAPVTLHTPLAVWAPEVIYGD